MWETICFESLSSAGSAPGAGTAAAVIAARTTIQTRCMVAFVIDSRRVAVEGSSYSKATAQPGDRALYHCPSGVVMSVPGGGVNLKFDGGSSARAGLELLVPIRSPFGCNMSVT